MKKKKITLIIIILLLVVLLAVGGYFGYKAVNKNKTAIGTAAVVDKIDKYGYTLEEDAPKVYKELFKELQDVLSKDEVDYEEYAKLVAQMTVVDFYNLDNKVSKNDIGGVQFIYSSYKENFVLEASETVYKYIEHNLYNDRTQQLPVVDSSYVDSIKTEKYQYQKIKDDEAYNVNVKLTYKKDMGYPSNVVVKLLHNDGKLEVYYMK
jgi:hypothetical protein